MEKEKNYKDFAKSNKKKEKNKVEKKLFILIFVLILIDQILKIVVLNVGEINIISGVLNLKVTQNAPTSYGDDNSNSTLMYIVTNLIVISVVVKFMMTQNEFISTKFKIFLSLIVAGGASNVIDRILRGYVIEFIDFKQLINIPVFNLADIYVLIGWVSVAAIFAVFTVEEIRKNKIERNNRKGKE